MRYKSASRLSGLLLQYDALFCLPNQQALWYSRFSINNFHFALELDVNAGMIFTMQADICQWDAKTMANGTGPLLRET